MKVSVMRKSTVKVGMKCILAGIVLITAVTFFHGEIAGMFHLNVTEETRLISMGLFWGGVSGGAGVLVSMIGFLRRSKPENNIQLAPTVIILIGMAILFSMLLISFFRSYEPQNVRTDETITI